MTHEIQYPENETKVAVYDTEAEAEAAQDMCYQNHIEHHPLENGYTCERWATPRQRIDGRWDIPICHHSDITGATNVEDYDPANYPVEEV